MNTEKQKRLSLQVMEVVEATLAKGQRVELIPGPHDSVKVVTIRRTIITDTIK